MTEKIKFTEEDKKNLFDHKDHKYDCSNEGASDAYTRIGDVVEKFFVYKSIHELKKFKEGINNDGKKYAEKNLRDYGKIPDPDSESKLVQMVYKSLWDNNYLEHCRKSENPDNITGDTMNSASWTLGKLYCKKKKIPQAGIKTIISKYCIKDREESDEEFFNYLFNKTDFKKFVSVYHTIGNFIPVPEGCNGPRGGATVKDYWDLTLLNIYIYFDENCDDKKKCIYNIIGNKEQLVRRYMDWLNSFGDWDAFVEKNYLQAFVDDTLYPRELWKGHFDDYKTGNALPKEDIQCEEYFKNAANWIEKRTETMIEKLKEIIN